LRAPDLLAELARKDIGTPARRKRNDDLCRPSLGEGAA
jgi:hypothetical protein